MGQGTVNWMVLPDPEGNELVSLSHLIGDPASVAAGARQGR
jgi:hypothetical protein